MPYKHHGETLGSLKLQPGSRFTRTLTGFDTGTRVYQCDLDMIDSLEPEVGTADSSLPGGRYSSMFVDDVDVEEGRNNLAKLTISFLGLKRGLAKPPVLAGDTSSEQFVNDANYVLTNQLPTISVVSVQDTMPDPFGTGQAAVPPGVPPTGEILLPPFYEGPIVFVDPIWQGWILKTRNFRQAGPYWEVTDGYEYLVVRSP
jgi:hypothetical protein